jgi:hypothetical protein
MNRRALLALRLFLCSGGCPPPFSGDVLLQGYRNIAPPRQKRDATLPDILQEDILFIPSPAVPAPQCPVERGNACQYASFFFSLTGYSLLVYS